MITCTCVKGIEETYIDVMTSPMRHACVFTRINFSNSAGAGVRAMAIYRIDAVEDDHLAYVSPYLDSLSPALRSLNRAIHDNPELGYSEYLAHENLVAFFAHYDGWKVSPRAYGIDTAFIAEYDTGRPGPIVSFNAEYDSLPNIGHACGHNLIATASVGAALAAASCASEYSLPGKIVLFGTPAEEEGGGKIRLLDAGAYKGRKVDVSLIVHPGNVRDAALVSTAALSRFKVEYFGKEAHAAAAPWEGINALDGLITAYTALSVLRQQTMPGDIIQGHITHGGAVPNIIHEYAAGVFVVRAKRQARLQELMKKVTACFEAGALSSGARLEITPILTYLDHVPNKALGRSYRRHFNRLLSSASSPEIMTDHKHSTELPEVDRPIEPPEQDIIDGFSNASTDQGDISYAMPSLHPGFQIRCEVGPHTPLFAAAAGTDDAHARAIRAAKALAATALDVLSKNGYLREIKEEWERDVHHQG
ncbi:amidohydrolase [Punctularia strigosozonata HHB-11173 SS5]|uniref:Amidohydrolase n=1 Tax=Punctularia strigosozonata (strain HHB-11173) TaxID=741275 RepID=R7S3X5_PUNST|nr:amidohydrolase [Punctularia strigosozonata HHB-11173 SS5]EIN04502.1 amidohydrolase [Punctularia strigosozonata HHB-11173 SS5]